MGRTYKDEAFTRPLSSSIYFLLLKSYGTLSAECDHTELYSELRIMAPVTISTPIPWDVFLRTGRLDIHTSMPFPKAYF
jgi:hypothetical protein